MKEIIKLPDEIIDILITLAHQGDVDAVYKLLKQYDPLISSIAKKFYFGRIEWSDLMQTGRVIAIEAINSYDKTRGTTLYTWLEKLLNQRLLASIQTLRLGFIGMNDSEYQIYDRMQKAITDYVLQNGINPSIQDIAQITGIAHRVVISYYNAFFCGNEIRSLDEKINIDGKNRPLLDALNSHLNTETPTLRKDFKKQMRFLVYHSGLTEKEIAAIEVYIHLKNMEGTSLWSEMGKRLGVSKQAAEQRTRKALLKLGQSRHIEDYLVYAENEGEARSYIKMREYQRR